MIRRALVTGSAALVFAGFWLLFVTSIALPEVVLGVVSAVPAALAAALIGHCCETYPIVRLGWFRPLGTLLARLFADTLLVFSELLRSLLAGRRVSGQFRAVPYAGLASSAGEADGRDGVVILLNSLTPNSVVLDVDRLDGLILLHQLVPESRGELWRSVVIPR